MINNRRKNMWNYNISLINAFKEQNKSKTKKPITITIDPDLIQVVNEIKNEYKNLKSRSSTIAFIIKSFYEISKLEKLKVETVKYYKSLTEKEIKEDKEWAEFSTKQAGKVWGQNE